MLHNILVGSIAIIGLFFIGTLALVFWPGPEPADGTVRTMQAFDAQGSALQAEGIPSATQSGTFKQLTFDARDKTELFARDFPGEPHSDPAITILLLHGVGGDSSQFSETAVLLREATGAEVITLDLRGHGQSGGNAWDVDYIGQHEHDVADVIAQLKRNDPDRKIVLAGHSMGGGIALRYAQATDVSSVDAYLLFAPNFGGTSPTTRIEGTGSTEQQEPVVNLRLKRLIGLVMLNSIGIDVFNYLPVFFLNTPPDFPAYSFRAIMSGEPKDYTAAIEAIRKPLLVLVGSDDEVFHGEQFEPIITAHSDGETILIEGATHDSIHSDEDAIEAVAEWLARI